MNSTTLRRYIPWVMLVIGVVLIWNVSQFETTDNAMPFSEFLQQVDAGEVESRHPEGWYSLPELRPAAVRGARQRARRS